ncbi:PREDICTED: otopetrin-3 [Thamnophis sirtalis]|uniref:Otopetrin-3 n=1 Tax=Thamnophis sirtalis TaxID=35019 RepID=A0A6I9Y562_9SAUR|nr:PREDICTED: otopetrin-3 [Thamnophis sirtalis]
MDSKKRMGEEHQLQEAGDESLTTQPESWQIHYEKSWLHQRCSSLLHRDKQAQKTGQLFSGLLAMNVVFLGSAFICSMLFNKVAITMRDVCIFLCILKILSLSWIAYYLLFTRRKPFAILYQDAHAGAIWIRANLVIWNSHSHLLHNPSFSLSCSGNLTYSCKDSSVTICKIFQKGYILLYPFNTEYCLICCSMLYVMWKNVGRRIIQSHISGTQPRFKLHGIIWGPLLGIAAIIIGICIFMIYQIQVTSSFPSPMSFILYYSYYICLLPVMTVAALAGTVIHALEERELDTLKNPTRNLDVILLMGTALGQIAISYFSIVAIVATHPISMLNSIILAYSISLIIQHISQNIFIIEGLHRKPLLMKKCEDSSPNMNNLETRQKNQSVSWTYITAYRHLNWKRRALKEISSFLIMCNIILWIMPSFGAHPVFENGIEKSFYGYSTWFAIVNFGLPLGVFYRMHSVGDLLEVYRSA